jgi:FtsP/CotA-like multicopper oxidase with cupredoxin domain
MSLTDRRAVLAGLGMTALAPATFRTAAAALSQSLMLRAMTDTVELGPGPRRSSTAAWTQQEGPRWPSLVPRYNRGTLLDISLQNELPVPAALSIRSIDGASGVEPLAAQPPLAPGARGSVSVPLRQAGTYLCDLWLPGDAAVRPTRSLPLIVDETEAVPVDEDQVFLIEEWRVRADGTAIAPGTDPGDARVFHTINNGYPSDQSGLPIRANQRLRFRFINAGQRAVIAMKLEKLDVRVMAIDGQPAEPFSARNGAMVLAPGSRVDAFVDVVGPPGLSFSMLLHDGKQERLIAMWTISNEPPIRPAPLPSVPALPSNGLPDRLDLKNALRVDLPLAGSEWVTPSNFTPSSARPAFQAKTGRTVVLALANHAAIATTFHLHGHHFRLLDRLDDGWKPFWLDTLAIEPGQTQRIAFAAEHAGRFLIEQAATDWAAPRLLRWYGVE